SGESLPFTVIRCRPRTNIVLPASSGESRSLTRSSALAASRYLAKSTGIASIPHLRTNARARTTAAASLITLLKHLDIDVIEFVDPVLWRRRTRASEAHARGDDERVYRCRTMLKHCLEKCIWDRRHCQECGE